MQIFTDCVLTALSRFCEEKKDEITKQSFTPAFRLKHIYSGTVIIKCELNILEIGQGLSRFGSTIYILKSRTLLYYADAKQSAL